MTEPPKRYSAIRLNDRSENSWAVVGPEGAIAQAQDGSLLMRLTRMDARDLVEAMNEARDAASDVGSARGARFVRAGEA